MTSAAQAIDSSTAHEMKAATDTIDAAVSQNASSSDDNESIMMTQLAQQQYRFESDAVKRATMTPFKYSRPSPVSQELYHDVLRGIAKNCKVGPFKATSGILLPYYLNATTNFLDKDVSPKITQIVIQYLQHAMKPLIPQEYMPNIETSAGGAAEQQNGGSPGSILICGMEVAGGVIVSQLCSASDSDLNQWADYVYIRKAKKSSGTKQQLEGPQFITRRTKESERAYAIWVDDALSTGSSMTEGIEMLLEEYNIQVIGALYLVDRAADRKKLQKDYHYLGHDVYNDMPILSIFDLEEVDDHFKELNPDLYKSVMANNDK